MTGADRAIIQARVNNSDSNLAVLETIRRYPGAKASKSMSNNTVTKTFKFSNDFINSISFSYRIIEEQQEKQKVTVCIDFCYSRYFRNNNLFPVTSEGEKVIIEEHIVEMVNSILHRENSEKLTRKDFKYFKLEITDQADVPSYYALHNTLMLVYRALCTNYSVYKTSVNDGKVTRKKTTTMYSLYDLNLEKECLTNYDFRLAPGWYFKIYSKSHEQNNKDPGSSARPRLRVEHAVTGGVLKMKLGSACIADITLERLEQEFVKPAGYHLLNLTVDKLKEDVAKLRDNLKDFEPRKLRETIMLNRKYIYDVEIAKSVVSTLTMKSERQKLTDRKKVEVALSNEEKSGEKARKFSGNLERLEFFSEEFLKQNIEIKVSYTKGISFIFGKNEK